MGIIIQIGETCELQTVLKCIQTANENWGIRTSTIHDNTSMSSSGICESMHAKEVLRPLRVYFYVDAPEIPLELIETESRVGGLMLTFEDAIIHQGVWLWPLLEQMLKFILRDRIQLVVVSLRGLYPGRRTSSCDLFNSS